MSGTKYDIIAGQGFCGSGENGYLLSWSWGALVNIIGELGSKLIIFWDIGSLAKKQKKRKGKASILFEFLKTSASGGGGGGGGGGASPTHPLVNSKCIYFHTYLLIY